MTTKAATEAERAEADRDGSTRIGTGADMARRPVFTPLGTRPYVREVNTEFVFHPGFSLKQKQRSVDSLHRSFLAAYPGARMLEVSGRSPLTLGVELSAFRLMIRQGGAEYPVESAFQASKVFADGGPFTDLLGASPRDAKRDPRLRASGELVGFEFFSRAFPLEPRTFFYDWLYVGALAGRPELVDELAPYTAFTDIEFNPKRSINCQARSVSLFQGLRAAGAVDRALKSADTFLRVCYDSGR